MQSALFAGVSSQLYSFFTAISGDNSNYTRRNSPQGALTFMILLSYAAMLFNSGAAISSFILVDSLSELPFKHASSEEDPYPRSSRVFAGPSYLLRKYGMGSKWSLALWHCKRLNASLDCVWSNCFNIDTGLFCYFAGIWCLILQIVTYVIMQEPDVVRIPIACVAVFIVLPLIMYAVPRSVIRMITSESHYTDRSNAESLSWMGFSGSADTLMNNCSEEKLKRQAIV